MFLSRPDILKHLENQDLRFDPPVPEERIAQVSIDLFLGRRFTTFKQPPGYITSIHMDPSLWDSEDLWEHTETDIFVLEPRLRTHNQKITVAARQMALKNVCAQRS